MSYDLQAQALEVFLGAHVLEGDARESYLDEACANNPRLRAEVLALLEMDARQDGALADSEIESHRAGLDQLADQSFPPAGPVNKNDPTSIADFHVLRRIGKGGMGLVYEARQDNPKRRVAVKVLRPASLTSLHRHRFTHEAQVLGRLIHPGIAQIYEAGTFDNGDGPQPFFAMEYVEGMDLLSWSRAAGRTRVDRLRVFMELCEAVQHAHLHGVVHRDLKPDNVLITAAGQPKILDFGVARAVDADIQLTTMHTEMGQLIGTIAYMSPEQAAGDSNQVDARSDIYTLGVLLFQLLADQLPHAVAGRSIPDAIRMIREQEPTSLSSTDTSLRGDLDTIARRAMEKEPARRYSSASELGADVGRFLANEPILARRPSAIYQLRKFTRRHRGLTAGAILAFLSLSVALALTARFAVNEARERRVAERATYRMTIANAGMALAEGLIGELPSLLESIAPGLRGWEHEYLVSQLSSHTWAVPNQSPDANGKGGHASVQFTRDDRRLVAYSDARTLAVYDAITGELVSSAQSGSPWIQRTLTLGPKTMAAATEDNRVLVMDLDTGQLLHEQVFEARILCLGFDGTGESLLAGVSDNGVLQVHVGVPGDLRPVPDAGPSAEPLDLHHMVHSRYRPNCGFNARTGERHSWGGWGASIVDVAPEAGMMIATTGTRSVGLWRLSDAGELTSDGELLGHLRRAVASVAITPDGRRAATLANHDAIRVWDLESNRIEATFGVDGVGACALSSDGRLLAGRDDSGLRVWVTDSTSHVLRGHETYVYDVAFSPDGRTLASRGYETLETRLWDTRDARFLGSVRQEANLDWAVQYFLEPPIGFALDSSALITVGRDHHVVTAELATEFAFSAQRQVVANYAQVTAREWSDAVGGQCSANNLIYSPDGTCFVRLTFEEILDVETEAPLSSLWRAGQRDSYAHLDASFSPDSRRIAIARGVESESRGGVRIHDVASGEILATLSVNQSDVYSVAWSPDGNRLATGASDNTIRIWDTEAFETLLVLRGHESYVHDLAWSPDGTQLASASGDGTVRLWDSLPVAKRVAQARAASVLREELRPRVEALVQELSDMSAVAARLRGASELGGEQKHEALRVLRELAIERRDSQPRVEADDQVPIEAGFESKGIEEKQPE